MKIGFSVLPINGERSFQHAVRGAGFYLDNLKQSLISYHPEHEFLFFTNVNELPKDVDIVHFPYFEPFFLSLPFQKRFKTVVTVHDLIPVIFPRHFPVGMKGSLKWHIQKFTLKHVDTIITDSESSKKDIVKQVGIDSSKIHVIYLAASGEFKKLEKSSILGSIRKKYKLPEKFVLYVGDATWNKNLPRIIAVVKQTDIPLVMVGKVLSEPLSPLDQSNPWNRDLVTVHSLTLNDKQFVKLGFIPEKDLVAIYNLATVLLTPSLYEGFGLPILEAMSCGCPVVTSKESSIPEVAEDAAFYVDPYSIESIAEGLKKIFYNKKLQESLSKRGLAQAKKFSWEKTARETIIVYEKIISS